MSNVDPIRQAQLMAARWQAVLDTAQDAIISITRDGRITLFNRAAESIFGYRADEAIGQPVTILMPSPYRDEHDGYIEHYQRTGEARAIGRIRDVQALHRDGTVFPVELSVSEASVGDDLLYSAVIRDVTERRRAERALDEARHEAMRRSLLADIGALTARLVHDLGNPVAGMSMLAQRILRRIKLHPTQSIHDVREPVEQILETVSRLECIIHEFKDVAREQRLNVTTFDLRALLRATATFWESEASDREIDLTLQPGPTVQLSADADKLRRVLDNLLKNALEAIDRGPGTVLIQLIPPGADGRLQVTITDDGPGIPTGVDAFALFETTKPNGTGLGLPICKQILLAHHGGITLAPAEPHGTVATLDLPASEPNPI